MSDRSYEHDIAAAAQLACVLEASAPKPGNISPGVDFGDTSYEDFLASAIAIGQPLGAAATRPIGETMHLAIQETRRWVRANTNLGIVLLFAPIARAAAMHFAHANDAVAGGVVDARTLRTLVSTVLSTTTVHDAREAYAAIRLASPGGLGTADDQDVADEPTVTLTEAMCLAADRDGIAREYATDFQATFEVAVPALDVARRDGLEWNDAILETYLTLLATSTDTHIARRAGHELAEDVTRQARDVLAHGGVRSIRGRTEIARMSAALRDDSNSANPGTTADLTAAAIFVVLLGGGWQSKTGSGGLDGASR